MDRASKQQRIDDGTAPGLARLQRVVNVRSTSNAALRQILNSLGIEAPRGGMTDARQARFASIMTTIALDLQDGGRWDWHLCHPNLLLTRLVSESPTLQTAFSAALEAAPCCKSSPWSLLVGFDEFVPGNKLQLQPTRKSMNLSFSFMELGGPALHLCIR